MKDGIERVVNELAEENLGVSLRLCVTLRFRTRADRLFPFLLLVSRRAVEGCWDLLLGLEIGSLSGSYATHLLIFNDNNACIGGESALSQAAFVCTEFASAKDNV
jgi:hypothetical protein